MKIEFIPFRLLTTQEKVNLRQAWLDKKPIQQCYGYSWSNVRFQINERDDLNWDDVTGFRIKPEPKLIPFTQKTFPVDALFSFNDKNWYKATTVGLDFVTFGGANYLYNSLKDPAIRHSVDGGKTWQPAGQIVND